MHSFPSALYHIIAFLAFYSASLFIPDPRLPPSPSHRDTWELLPASLSSAPIMMPHHTEAAANQSQPEALEHKRGHSLIWRWMGKQLPKRPGERDRSDNVTWMYDEKRGNLETPEDPRRDSQLDALSVPVAHGCATALAIAGAVAGSASFPSSYFLQMCDTRYCFNSWISHTALTPTFEINGYRQQRTRTNLFGLTKHPMNEEGPFTRSQPPRAVCSLRVVTLFSRLSDLQRLVFYLNFPFPSWSSWSFWLFHQALLSRLV